MCTFLSIDVQTNHIPGNYESMWKIMKYVIDTLYNNNIFIYLTVIGLPKWSIKVGVLHYTHDKWNRHGMLINNTNDISI